VIDHPDQTVILGGETTIVLTTVDVVLAAIAEMKATLLIMDIDPVIEIETANGSASASGTMLAIGIEIVVVTTRIGM
jgi:hypothetical protein